jgi:hypothetical protein
MKKTIVHFINALLSCELCGGIIAIAIFVLVAIYVGDRDNKAIKQTLIYNIYIEKNGSMYIKDQYGKRPKKREVGI